MICLIFVRPLELLIYHHINGKQQASQCEKNTTTTTTTTTTTNNNNNNKSIETGDKFLFSSGGNQLNYNLLTSSFEKCFLEQTKVKWNVRDYRQYHSGIIKNFISTSANAAGTTTEENITNHLHEQSGHSIDTAHGTYGVSNLDMKKLDSAQLEVWRRASYRWHEAIGLNENKQPAQTTIALNEVPAVAPAAPKKQPIHSNNSNDAQEDRLTLLQNMIQGLEKKMDSVIAKIDYLQHDGKTGTKRNVSCMAQKRLDVVNNDTILQALRKCLKNNQAQFRNDDQRQSLKHVSNVEQDTLCIHPTGSGKSYLFLIQPFLRPQMVSIVIVPLVALQMDLVEKCRKIGITAYLWDNRHSAGGQLIFCSCEHVNSQGYTSFVNEYSKTGKLYAIFFDEAHLVKQWADFRPVFHRLQKHIRPQHCNIPIIALTATCPPTLESHVTNMLSLRQDQLRIFRQTSVLKNISYNLVSCDEQNLSLYLVQFIAKYLNPLKDTNQDINVNTPCKLIIYFQTRAECESLFTKVKGVVPIYSKMFMFHAGMSKSDRNKQEQQWSDISDTKSLHVLFCNIGFRVWNRQSFCSYCGSCSTPKEYNQLHPGNRTRRKRWYLRKKRRH